MTEQGRLINNVYKQYGKQGAEKKVRRDTRKLHTDKRLNKWLVLRDFNGKLYYLKRLIDASKINNPDPIKKYWTTNIEESAFFETRKLAFEMTNLFGGRVIHNKPEKEREEI